MKKQKKQSLLTTIITILVIVLIVLVGSIFYEEAINIGKQQTSNTSDTIKENEKNESDLIDKDKILNEDEIDDETEEITDESNQEYIGEEENNEPQNTAQTNEEKAIDLVKKEWGNDDSVTFNIEKKNGTKYRVAVRDNSTTVLQWYEVDTETWEVSEY